MTLVAWVGPACSGTAHEASPSDSRPAATGATSTDGSHGIWEELPVLGNAYRSSLDVLERDALARGNAAYEANVECMRDKGFRGYRVETTPQDAAVLQALARPLDESEADERGLNVVASLVRSNTEAVSFGASEEEQRAAESRGIDREAFEAAASECNKVFSASEASVTLPTLADSYDAEVLDDPEIAAALDSWRSCITDATGLDVDAFSDLVPLLQAKVPGDDRVVPPGADQDELVAATRQWLAPVFELERSVATAVVRCDRSAYTPVLDRWAELERSWQDRHSDRLASLSVAELAFLPTMIKV